MFGYGVIDYDGLIVTTIKLELPDGKTVEDLEDGDKVVFSEGGGNEGSKVHFLKDIKQMRWPQGFRWGFKRVFDATYVRPETAAAIAKKGYGTGKESTPLFIVHGFNVEPGSVLQKYMPKALERLGEEKIHFPIPVIWPVDGGVMYYNKDQDRSALTAGANLGAFVNGVPNDLFPKKSLVCHSMGNHVVFNGALGEPGDAPDVKLENIYLVAAVRIK